MNVPRELTLRTTPYIRHRPSARQLAFLLLPHLEAFFGGAAGGGKSDALLMAALQYVDVPGYRALIVRESFAALEEAGGLIERSRHWSLGSDASWSVSDHVWRFPAGATLSFRPLRVEGGERSFMGAEYQFIGIDEATLITEDQYRFLLTRLRRLKHSPLPLRIRLTGMPHGPGVEWVRRRFVDEGRARGRPFIPSRLEDNEYLDQEAYEATLSNLDHLTRARIRFGDWSVRTEGGLFRADWFDEAVISRLEVPARTRLCRAWDLAATEPRPGTDPDYTAGALLGRDPDGTYFLVDVCRTRGSSLKVQRLVRRTAEEDVAWADERGLDPPKILIEEEPGSSGKAIIDHYRREVLRQFPVQGKRVSGSKESRATPVAARAEAGEIKLCRGNWITAFLDEIVAFPEGSHDDQVDALSAAFGHLAKTREFIAVSPFSITKESYWRSGDYTSWW